jgi:hypothetical protein
MLSWCLAVSSNRHDKGLYKDADFQNMERRVGNRQRVGDCPYPMRRIFSSSENLHNLFAHLKGGDDVMLIKNISEADGHALCQTLHRQFGVSI